jgi:hypothetical protein
MDPDEATDVRPAATPIFNVYRRGYDPEQVDRYVADQQRRLDEALHRASEAERKLAAAVGQLRELHRRVAVLEAEERSPQPPSLDTLGERVQRILQEAWEGAYTLRQEAEREAAELRERTAREVEELRERTAREAAQILEEAKRRAFLIKEETERRRQAYLERVEQDRERAVEQIIYLLDQRQQALAELSRLQATIEATVEEMVRSPLARPGPAGRGAGAPLVGSRSPAARERGAGGGEDTVPFGEARFVGPAAGPGASSGGEGLAGSVPVDPGALAPPPPAAAGVPGATRVGDGGGETARGGPPRAEEPTSVLFAEDVLRAPETGTGSGRVPPPPRGAGGHRVFDVEEEEGPRWR